MTILSLSFPAPYNYRDPALNARAWSRYMRDIRWWHDQAEQWAALAAKWSGQSSQRQYEAAISSAQCLQKAAWSRRCARFYSKLF